MTPNGLLRMAADLAQSLKESYTADNGISDLRPSLHAYDGHGERLVSVMLNSAEPADIGTDAIALAAAWQPWALVLITECYVRLFDSDDEADAEMNRPDRSFARDYAAGDERVQEAVAVSCHYRTEASRGVAMPFRYLTAHTVEWIDVGDLYEGEGLGGRVHDVMEVAIGVNPLPGLPLAAARMECIDFLRERGCLVVT